jgi:hypothetical protein
MMCLQASLRQTEFVVSAEVAHMQNRNPKAYEGHHNGCDSIWQLHAGKRRFLRGRNRLCFTCFNPVLSGISALLDVDELCHVFSFCNETLLSIRRLQRAVEPEASISIGLAVELVDAWASVVPEGGLIGLLLQRGETGL